MYQTHCPDCGKRFFATAPGIAESKMIQHQQIDPHKKNHLPNASKSEWREFVKRFPTIDLSRFGEVITSA